MKKEVWIVSLILESEKKFEFNNFYEAGELLKIFVDKGELCSLTGWYEGEKKETIQDLKID
jgi:hypothetical protein